MKGRAWHVLGATERQCGLVKGDAVQPTWGLAVTGGNLDLACEWEPLQVLSRAVV